MSACPLDYRPFHGLRHLRPDVQFLLPEERIGAKVGQLPRLLE